jgi:hypothetical protein
MQFSPISENFNIPPSDRFSESEVKLVTEWSFLPSVTGGRARMIFSQNSLNYSTLKNNCKEMVGCHYNIQ